MGKKLRLLFIGNSVHIGNDMPFGGSKKRGRLAMTADLN